MAFYEMVFSATGRTLKAAQIVSSAWEEPKIQVDLSRLDFDGTSLCLKPEDVCLVAAGIYGGRIPQPAAEKLGTIAGNGARAILMAVYGNRAVDDGLAELQDILTKQGFCCAAAIEAVAEHSMMPRFGAGRPDEEDRAELTDFAKWIQAVLTGGEIPPLRVPGNVPLGASSGKLPLSIQTDKTCKACGKCAELCPVGAISRENPKVTDRDTCILCMRCTAVCPVHARHLPGWSRILTPLMAGKLGGRKENKLYLPK